MIDHFYYNKFIYHCSFMDSAGYGTGFISESSESRSIIETGIANGFIEDSRIVIAKDGHYPRGSKAVVDFADSWERHIDCIIAPRINNSDSEDLYSLYQQISSRKKDIVLFDQSWGDSKTWQWAEEEPGIYRYRKLDLVLHKDTVIPSYYANSNYIDIMVGLFNGKRATLMDLCSGSGCVGLSVFRECFYIDGVYLVDINPCAVKSLSATVRLNKIPNSEIILSDCFSNIPESIKVNYIIGNPPHQDRKTPTLRERAGGDEDWHFHKSLFSSADKHLVEDGLICLIENGRPDYSTASMFHDMVKQCNRRLELFKSEWIHGSEWYLIYIRKI